jgi:hypothetical protein
MEVKTMNQPSIVPSDTRFAFNPTAGEFPFTCELSLAPLVAFWQQASAEHHPMQAALSANIQQALRKTPALLEPIEDLSLIAAHKDLVDAMMTAVFPPATWHNTYAAALCPFQMQSFYATPSFERLMLSDDGYLSGRMNVDEQTVAHVRLLHTYAFVLYMVYGIELDFEYPLIYTASDPDTGLDRHFRMDFEGRFMQVKTLQDVKPLTAAEQKRLMANLTDPQVLMELIPPDQFIISGFAVLNTVEVTDQEVLSSLKRDLIEKESIVSNERFNSLQAKLCTLFRKPNLLLGLAAIQGDQVLVLNYGSNIEYG